MLSFGLALLLTGATGADAAQRVALIMVAEEYQKLPRPAVGLKRGNEIADALKARGFDVIFSANPGNGAARAALRDFSEKATDAELALAVLIGHGAAWRGQTFFLTTNTEIGRATDLLSRALSVTNVAQIAGRAKQGGVFFFMAVPHFDPPVEGLDTRPQFAAELKDNVFAVFSNSARVPVSRVDAINEQGAEALTKLLQRPDPSLGEAVKAAASGNLGLIFGSPADLSLAKPPVHAAAPPAQPPAPPGVTAPTGGNEGRLEAERQAREAAERRARLEQVRAEQAQAEVLKAQADAKKAQADAERAQADARKAQAEAERVQAEAERAKLEAQRVAVIAKAPPSLDDAQLGQKQRLLIQKRLRDLGLYTGPIDSIMGPLTREAIMGFQKSRGAAVTGYLTPKQYETLASQADQTPVGQDGSRLLSRD